MLAAIAYLMGCNGLLFSLGGGWQMLPMAPKYFPSLPVEAERQTFMEFSGVYARRYVCMQVRVRACTCEGNEGVLSLGPSSLIEGQSASQAVCPPWGP